MADMKKIAKHLIRTEAERSGLLGPDAQAVADSWADLMLKVVDSLTDSTAAVIAELVVDYLTDDDDGA